MAVLSHKKCTMHHEMFRSVQNRQEVKGQKLKTILKEVNPFSYEGVKLVNVVTKSVVPESI